MLIVPVEFTDWHQPTNAGPAVLESEAKLAIAEWNKIFGNDSFTYDISPVVSFPVSYTTFTSRTQVEQQALKIARANGHHGAITFVLGPQIAGYRSSSNYINMPNPLLAGTWVHETGHRLGLGHTSCLPAPPGPYDPDAGLAAWKDALRDPANHPINQWEYCDTDFMGNSAGPGPWQELNCVHRAALGLPETHKNFPSGSWVYWLCGNGDLFVVGPYVGQWPGMTHPYIVTHLDPGETFTDKRGVTVR